jgi:VCBS repeat-containing protein
MKNKQKSIRGKSNTRRFGKRLPLRFYGALEPLESREVLAANVLASTIDVIETPGDTDDVFVIVETPDSPGASVTLQLQLISNDGNVDPLAPQVLDAAGNPVAATMMNNGNGRDGVTIVDVPAGEYTIVSGSQLGTTGEYTLTASLLGDVETADSQVSEFERLRASAAMTQFLGTGNFVTDLFYQTRGIDMGVDQYDVGFDANGNGGVDASDFQLIENNAGIGTVNIEFIPDTTAPLISGLSLVSDTGISSTDGITSVAAVSGTITDEREITQILAALDGGTLVDVTSSVAIDANDRFVIGQTLMNTLAGGTLSDGAHTLNLSAVDDLGNTVDPTVDFSFVFIANNVAPTTSGVAAATATEDAPFSLDISSAFSDQTGDVLTFTVAGRPDWLMLDGSTLSGTPRNADVGVLTLTATATDFDGLAVDSTFNITVVNTNDPPVVASIADQTAEEDAEFTLDIGSFVSDPDVSDNPTISVLQLVNGVPEDLPAWLSFDETTQILSGTPSDGDGGAFTVVVRAVDLSADDSTTFTITVQDLNDVPVFGTAIPDQSVNEGDAFSLNAGTSFSDPDPGDSLTFSATADGGELPAWLSIESATGVLSGTADDADVGTINVVVTATDNFGQAASSNSIAVTVVNVNEAPDAANQTFRVLPTAVNGTTVATIVATDPDVGDVLTYSLTGGSGSGIFLVGSSTGDITVSDDTMLVDGETLELNVRVTDAGGLSDNAIITINVSLNDPPVANDDAGFSATDVTPLTINGSVLVQNDTDTDGNTLSVSAVSATSAQGAAVSVDTTTGLVTYDPSASSTLLSLQDGESLVDTFTYTVSDGNGGTDMATVSVTVNGTTDVQFLLRTFDAAGNEVTSVDPGENFELRVFVQDVTDVGEGVFSAYLDVTYSSVLASVDGAIVHSTTYPSATSGSTTVGGVIDEVGGIDGLSPLGSGEFEVFRLGFTAGSTDGLLTFNADPAEDQTQHPILLFGENSPLPVEQVQYGTVSLAIGNVAPLSGGGSSITNLDNAYDVNGDGQVSPLDALMVINVVNGTHDGSGIYFDVNADGVSSPLDALLVINEMATPTPAAPLTDAIIEGDDGSTLAVDDLFAAISDESIELGQPWDDIVDFVQTSPTLVTEVTEYLSTLDDSEEIADFNDWLEGLQGQL